MKTLLLRRIQSYHEQNQTQNIKNSYKWINIINYQLCIVSSDTDYQ